MTASMGVGSRRTGAKGNGLVAASLALMAVGLSVLGVGLSRYQVDERISFTAAGTFVYIVGLFLLVFGRFRGVGLFSLRLGAWSLAYASVVFGLASVTIIDRQVGSAAIIDKASVPGALVLIVIAYSAWAVGYAVGATEIVKWPLAALTGVVTKGRSSVPRGVGVLIGVFLVGVASDLVSAVALGRYGYLGDVRVEGVGGAAWYSQPLVVLSTLKSAALLGLAIRAFVLKKEAWWVAVLPMAGIAVAMSLATGLKESFVTVALAVGVPLLLSGHRRALLWVAATAVTFVLVISPLVNGIRQDVTNGQGRLGVAQSLEVVVDGVTSGRYFSDRTESDSSVTALERLRLIDNPALIADRTPSSIPYRSWTEIAAAPVTGLVPRLLWPDKPARLSGYEFYVQYYEGAGSSSSALTLPGSLYLYGGALVVVLGMLFVGMALRAADDVLDAAGTLTGAMAFLLAFNVVVKQEMDVATFLAGLPVLALTWTLAVFAVFARADSRRPEGTSARSAEHALGRSEAA